MDQPVTPEAAVWLYKCILGRPPESYDAIEGLVRNYKNISEARASLLMSSEFQYDQEQRLRNYDGEL